MNKHVVEFLECNNIHRQLTIAYTPKQSLVIERDNHIILKTTHNNGVPLHLCAKIVHTTIYILNSNITHLFNGITPFEAWRNLRNL
jgi:hypothetical protein